MPGSKRRGASSASSKKKKKRAAAKKDDEEETNVSDDADVLPVDERKPAPSSSSAAQSLDAEEDESNIVSDDHKIVLQVLGNIYKNHSTHEDSVAEKGFAFMATLVQHNNKRQEDLMKPIIDAGGIKLITMMMKNHPWEKGLQKEGRAFLGLLCEMVEDNKKPDHDAIKAVLNVMETLPYDGALQAKCCRSLRVDDDVLKEFVGETGGIDLIVTALKNHPDEEDEVLGRGLMALVGLVSTSPPNRKRVADAGGIGVAVKTLNKRAWAGSPQGFLRILKVLMFLNKLACEKECIRPIIEASGHEAIVNVMNRNSQNDSVQMRGCKFLANLVGHGLKGICKDVADVGAISAVVKAMQAHPNKVEVVKHGCCVLFNLSRGDNKEVKKAIVQAGGLEALAAVLRVHSSKNEKELVSWAKKTIKNCTPSSS